MPSEPSRTTIVLLPRMDGTGELFKNFVDARPPGVEALVVDYPPDAALGYDALKSLVQRRLPQDRPYFVLAESFSGPIGLMLAAQPPQGMRGLILCCTFAKNPLPLLGYFKFLISLLGFSFLPPMLSRLGHRALFGHFANDETRKALSDSLKRLRPQVLQARMRAVLDCDVTNLLPRVALPALYLQAGEDRVVPRSVLDVLHRFLPHMPIAHIAAPHMLLQSAPREAWSAIEAFLNARNEDPN